MIYIVRRTQLYLDDDLWKLLHMIARQSGGTISELVRNAIREKYSQNNARRKEACEAIVGLWKDRTDIGETSMIRTCQGKTDLSLGLTEGFPEAC
jgi:metal-responsive CopG/Arc/MetJ family transcriptional regulator